MERIRLDDLAHVSGGASDEAFEGAEPAFDSFDAEPLASPEPAITETPVSYEEPAPTYEEPQTATYEPQAATYDQPPAAASSDEELRRAVDDYFRTPSHERLANDLRLASEQFERDRGRAFEAIESRDRVSYDRSSPSAIALADEYLASEPRVSSYDAEGARLRDAQHAYAMARVEWWARGGPMPWNGPAPTMDDTDLGRETNGLNNAARTLARAGARR